MLSLSLAGGIFIFKIQADSLKTTDTNTTTSASIPMSTTARKTSETCHTIEVHLSVKLLQRNIFCHLCDLQYNNNYFWPKDLKGTPCKFPFRFSNEWIHRWESTVKCTECNHWPTSVAFLEEKDFGVPPLLLGIVRNGAIKSSKSFYWSKVWGDNHFK